MNPTADARTGRKAYADCRRDCRNTGINVQRGQREVNTRAIFRWLSIRNFCEDLRLPIFHGAICKRLRIWLRQQSFGLLGNCLCRLLLICLRHHVPARVSGNVAFLQAGIRGPLAHGNGSQQNLGAVRHNRFFASPANIWSRSNISYSIASRNSCGTCSGHRARILRAMKNA